MSRMVALCVAMCVLAALTTSGSATVSEPVKHVLDVDASMLLGTYPVPIGEPEAGGHVPGGGPGPVSQVVLHLTTEPCYVALELLLEYRSLTMAAGTETAVLGLRLVDDQNDTLADWFATDGRLHVAYDDPVLRANSTYTAELYHIVGGPVDLHLDGWLHHWCADQ